MKNQNETRWKKLDIALSNYKLYIENKHQKSVELSYIDLLFVSNFKGGNASICEKSEEVNNKLIYYKNIINEIKDKFGNKKLSQLDKDQTENIIECIGRLTMLTKQIESSIDGFKSSYLSALLHAHFPNLIPILDRRVLINLELVDLQEDVKSNGQIKNIDTFYEKFIFEIQALSRQLNKSIRDLDKELFIQKLK